MSVRQIQTIVMVSYRSETGRSGVGRRRAGARSTLLCSETHLTQGVMFFKEKAPFPTQLHLWGSPSVQRPFTHGETKHRSRKATEIQQTRAEQSWEPHVLTRSSLP